MENAFVYICVLLVTCVLVIGATAAIAMVFIPFNKEGDGGRNIFIVAWILSSLGFAVGLIDCLMRNGVL